MHTRQLSRTANDFDATTPNPYDSLANDGAAVFRGVFCQEQIAWARQVVQQHIGFMPNTRPFPGSRHMAGFHRFPSLEPLHSMMTGNPAVREIMERLCGERARTIGLSDITVNRSQQWHKDLLRGRFEAHLGAAGLCADWHGTVFKLIVYLQDSASLKIVPGSHRQDIDLSSDDHAIPREHACVVPVPVLAGDVVVIDICTTHRGSPDQAFSDLRASGGDPKILISTVFGRHGAPLTDRMEIGNAERLNDWTARHLEPSSSLRLPGE